MTKRFWNVLFLLILSVSCFAIPAKRGVYKMITLADGSQVRAELCGDEHIHFWQTEDGRKFIKDDANDCFVEADLSSMTRELTLPAQSDGATITYGPRRAAGEKPSSPITGSRKGLIVLVQFSDVKFAEGHDKAYYNNIVNTRNYTTSPFVGSVRDYFYDQSDGLLDYSFDIVGTITLPKECSYYGGNSGSSTQKNMRVFVTSTLDAIKDSVDFSNYDNDNDGWVDNVFFIYAGYGEADSDDENSIWPHMYYLYRGFGRTFKQNGVQVDVYACSNEIQGDGTVDGIGAICHEFSHCLGLPDMYDTDINSGETGNYGTGNWDIMNSGCYLGNTFRPCGYTAYERDYIGWRTIVELSEDQTINTVGLTDGGTAYKMSNPKNSNEYFILEPRNTTGWDKDLPGTGLLIYHVDYDYSAWISNKVNNTDGHQRCAIVAADNKYSSGDDANDAFPYGVHNGFADNTTPASTLFNTNTDGTYKLGKSVYDIARRVDGSVSFSYMKGTYVYDNHAPEGSLFYESFGRCAGTGGNDGYFTGDIAIDEYLADNDGWVAANKYAGDKCAKFGTNRQNGNATTPEITLNGTATLTFKAASYAAECGGITLSVASGSATLAETSFKIATKGEWNEFTTTVEASGTFKLKFAGTKRWFLDEVLLMPADPSGIKDVAPAISQGEGATYNVAGQKVGENYRGIVVRNGRKYIK